MKAISFTRKAAAAGVALALGLSAVACSSSSGSSSTTTTTVPSSTTTAAPLTEAGLREQLQDALLHAADLGAGYVDVERPVPDPNSPTPCGAPNPVGVVSTQLSEGSRMTNTAGTLTITEDVSFYGDPPRTQAAMDAMVAALGCGSGVLPSGEPFTVSGPEDVTDELGQDKALKWEVTVGERTITVIVVQKFVAVMAFEYDAQDAAAAASIEVMAVTQQGVEQLTTS